MTTLVVGASGATGRLLVEQLCDRGQNVKVIVRSPDRLPETLRHPEGSNCPSIKYTINLFSPGPYCTKLLTNAGNFP